MKHFLIIALLLGLFLVVACDEEAVEKPYGSLAMPIGEPITPQEDTVPTEEFDDVIMVNGLMDRLYTAVAEGDRKTVMEICFPPLDLIIEEKNWNKEEQLALRERRAEELELFEQDWARLNKAGTSLLEWTCEVMTITAPAGGEFYLVVYTVDVELLMTGNNGLPKTVEHSTSVHYLNSKLLYAEWPFCLTY